MACFAGLLLVACVKREAAEPDLSDLPVALDAQERGLTFWGRELVSLRLPLRVLDVEHGTSSLVQVDGLEQVLSVAGDSRRFALGFRQGVLVLKKEEATGWSELPVPDEVQADTRRQLFRATIGASGEFVALSWQRYGRLATPLQVFDGHAWHSVTLEGIGEPETRATHLVFVAGRWLVGVDGGEFGGGLWSVSTAGRSHHLSGFEMVRAIVPRADGRAVVLDGLAHIVTERSVIHDVGADDASALTFELVASFEKVQRRTNWPGGPDSITAAALDAQGRLIIAARKSGLFELRADGVHPLEVAWPGGVWATSLLFHSGHLLIDTSQHGLLVWPEGSTELRPFQLDDLPPKTGYNATP